MKKYKSKKGRFIILLIILAFLIVVLWPSNIEKEVITKINQTQEEVTQLTDTALGTITNQKEETNIAKETTDTSINKKLCEDYTLEQGIPLELDGNKVTVDKIGSRAIKVTINDKEELMSESEYSRIDGFGVTVNKILYFNPDDKNNLVELRLGCVNNKEDPKDKYVREKGATACKEIINQIKQECTAKFNLDKDYFN